MISLKEIFLEAGDEGEQNPQQKKVKSKKKLQQPQAQPQQQVQQDPEFLKQTQKGLNHAAARQPQQVQPNDKIPSLSQLAKGADKDPALADLPKFDNPQGDDEFPHGNPDFSNSPMYRSEDEEDNPKMQQDPDFLKAIQKGLSNLKHGAPARDPESIPPPVPLAKQEPNDKIPSLSQLAKGAEEPEDPALAGLPKFDQEPEQDPFGNPDFQQQPTPAGGFQTLPQKTASAVKKTVGQAAAGAKNALRSFGQQRGTEPTSAMGQQPQPAMGKTNNPDDVDGLPSSWKTPSGEEPNTGTQPGDSDDMPTLRSLSKQRFGKDVFKDTSSKWRVGDIVRVGTLDGFKVQRKDPNGWVLTRKDQNYKFIPHGGLFKV